MKIITTEIQILLTIEEFSALRSMIGALSTATAIELGLNKNEDRILTAMYAEFDTNFEYINEEG